MCLQELGTPVQPDWAAQWMALLAEQNGLKVTPFEFREALSHRMATKAFDEFLFEGRKLNMAVWLALQDLSIALDSPLGSAILQQCFTKVYAESATRH